MIKRNNTKGNPRKAGKEQYYTLPKTAEKYAKVMVERYGIDHLWLEPSGGKGNLIDALLAQGVKADKVESYDIEPYHHLVQLGNFLETIPFYDGCYVFGNPPFGRACSLAIKFFNQCAKRADVIGFIIPPSFNKPSIQDQLDPHFHQVYKDLCPSISFYDDEGRAHEGGILRTEFQIWERQEKLRPKLQSYRSKLFSFVKKGDECDIAFRTHGSGAGRVLEKLDYNPRTTAFIKLHDPRALDALKSADYSYYLNSTSHIPCLAPAEIAMCVDEWFSKNSDK
jgi:hypothetical protein